MSPRHKQNPKGISIKKQNKTLPILDFPLQHPPISNSQYFIFILFILIVEDGVLLSRPFWTCVLAASASTMPVSTIYIPVATEHAAFRRAEPLSNLTVSPQGFNFSLASFVFYVTVYQV